MGEKVLVYCASGKCGRNVCRALIENGFEVYGTTRSKSSSLEKLGVKTVVADYTKRKDLDRAFAETGAKRVVAITDFFLAAKQNVEVEFEHGKIGIEAARAAGVVHFIFISIIGGAPGQYEFPSEIKHFFAKQRLEAYLAKSGYKDYSVLGPCAFFENFDDPVNYNPLTKGSLKFLTLNKIKFCSTYDVGRAASVMFNNPRFVTLLSRLVFLEIKFQMSSRVHPY